jgi:hypothetical protein
MFGLFKRKQPIVHQQWIVPIMDFSSDASAFYAAVEAEVHTWEVPNLITERITFNDGGFLSTPREYLRIRRESLVFDILSARFGRSWWFSCRSAVLPRMLRFWDLLALSFVIQAVAVCYLYAFGTTVAYIAMSSTVGMLLVMMVAARSWNGLDDLLLKLPVIGSIYAAVFRPESYYLDDSRRMYVTIVDHLVREQVRVFAKAGGVDDVQFNEVTDIRQLTTISQRVREFVGEDLIATAKTIAKELVRP